MIRRQWFALCLGVLGGLAAAAARADVDPALVAAMKWRQVGPFRGGRVEAVAGVEGDPTTWYFGGVAGGVFKSTDAGASWRPVFDGQPTGAIGAIAVAKSDPNVVYVGTGEPCPRGNVTYGDGVYKSVDGGRTWRNVGLKDSRQIAAVVVSPTNPDVVLVAALGHVFGPNAERGVFRTTDGGRTWTRVLFKDQDTGAVDLAADPGNPNVVYASLWQFRRQPWTFSSGGPGSGLYRSTDGGATWAPVAGSGLPTGLLGRIGLSVAGGGSGRVYALIEADEGGLFRSDDGGAHWSRVNADHRFRQRAWYFSHVIADPTSRDVVYVLNTGAFRSVDGGATFELMPAPHGDHHALWVDPRDPRRLINGSDGGASISVDGGRSWTQPYNQPTAQFYHVAVDNHFPYRIYGAQQDNSTVAIASRSDEGAIGRQDWYPIGGGESGYIAPDPRDPEIVYANAESGQMTRYDHRTNNFQDVSIYPLDVSGNGAAALKYRFQWTSPLYVSRFDSNVLYSAAQYVFRSPDQGRTWVAISPDLTRDDKTKQIPSGGPITLDITSVEYYDTVFALAESHHDKAVLWAGTDDGLVHLTRDGGGHWANVTPKDLPAWSLVSQIEASPHDPGGAYVAVDRHKFDDLKPLAFRTHDYGKTWTKIVTGIPDGAFVRAVREDPKRPGLLYAATERGVYFSVDDGGHWQSLQLNLPQSPVHDLVVKDDDLVAATHGRAFWILDDIAPLRELAAGVPTRELHLFTPASAVRLHFPMEVEKRLPVGDNPPNGAVIDYWLPAAAAEGEEVVLEILAGDGSVLRRISNLKPKDSADQPPEWTDRQESPDTIPAEAGANRFAWDLRMNDPTPIPGAFYSDEGPKGPRVNPGRYQVRLTYRGTSRTVPLEVVLDPRLKGTSSDADLAALLDLHRRTAADVDALHRAVNQIRETRGRLDTVAKWTGDDPATKPVRDAIAALEAKMAPVEGRLVQVKMHASEDNLRYPNMLNEQYDTFMATLDSGDVRPTAAQKDVFSYLHGELDKQLVAWREIVARDLAPIDALLREHGVPSVKGVTPP